MTDPRYYQLLIQGSLLSWGIFALGFTLSTTDVFVAFSLSLSLQYALTRFYKLAFKPLSTINSSMSLLILLHVADIRWMLLAIVITIASKFFIRFNNRHIFNPSNIGIVAVLLLTDSAWIASGQWGHAIWLALLLSGIGLVFFIGFSRLLTSISFLVVFSLLILSKSLWVGNPIEIPIHQLQNGALLIFAFFMLADPMTTPDSRYGRILFGSMVAIIGWLLQITYYIPNAFLYALALSSPFVVVINNVFSGHKFQWANPNSSGVKYANKNT